MLWQELTVHTTEEAQEMISNLLVEAGAGGVSIEESGTLNKTGIHVTVNYTMNRSMTSPKGKRSLKDIMRNRWTWTRLCPR